jgi:hypothetical protein
MPVLECVYSSTGIAFHLAILCKCLDRIRSWRSVLQAYLRIRLDVDRIGRHPCSKIEGHNIDGILG